jgi:alpha-1,6-mannosyltransferase
VRTVHLTNAWHAASGGVRACYLALLTEAGRRRRHMAVVVPGETTTVTHLSSFARLYTVRAPRSFVGDRRYRMMLPFSPFRHTHAAIEAILAEEHPNLVEIADKYTLYSVARAVARRPPAERPTLVAFSHERLDDSLGSWVGATAATRAFARWYLRHVYLPPFDAHLANSAYTAAELASAMSASDNLCVASDAIVPACESVHILPMGVDTAIFATARRSVSRRDDLLRLAGGSPSSALVVFAGRLSPDKHVEALPPILRAVVARGVDARLIVVGDGPARAALERDLERSAPHRSAWIGHATDRSTLASILASADVFLHPNPREPFGIGPLEAMAAGVPVVLPRAGGVLSYATPVNSWLADPHPDAMASAVVAALTSPDEARIRVDQARATAARHAWPIIASQFFDTYDRLDAARRASSDDRPDPIVHGQRGWMTPTARSGTSVNRPSTPSDTNCSTSARKSPA